MINYGTLSWKEHCAIVKADGKDPFNPELVQANFECWMRERHALNLAMAALYNIGNHAATIPEQLVKEIINLEKDQYKLSAAYADKPDMPEGHFDR